MTYRNHKIIQDHEIEHLSNTDGEYLIYDEFDNLAGSAYSIVLAKWLIDEFYNQGVFHESLLV